MAEVMHTPGPWVAHITASGRVCFVQGASEPGAKFGAAVTNSGGIAGPCSERGRANARLIAAAPELLEALEDFDNWFCGFNPEDRASRMEGRLVVIRARAAIAKARSQPSKEGVA